MKFLCPNCKAKYQIADEKVAGRTLKMDCRRCAHSIVLRGDQPQADELDEPVSPAPAARPATARPAPAAAGRSGSGLLNPGAARRPATGRVTSQAASPSTSRPAAGASASRPGVTASTSRPGTSAAPRSALSADFRRSVGGNAPPLSADPPARTTALDQWHVAINDVPVGPMRRDEITRKIATGAIHGESLAWREGFDDWRPLREIPELAQLLRRGGEAARVSERPAARPGAPRPPAPAARGATSRPGTARPADVGARAAASAPAPAAAARSAAPISGGRSNVVAIGGRLGASAAPALDEAAPELDELDEDLDGEPTRVASAFDLPIEELRASGVSATPIAQPAPVARPKSSPPRPAVTASPAATASSLPDPFPATPAATSSPAMASVVAQHAPMSVRREPRRQIPISAWIAIAGAMTFGVSMAVLIAPKILGTTAPPAAATSEGTSVAAAPTQPQEAEVELPPAPTEVAVADVVEEPEAPAAATTERTGRAPTKRATAPAASSTTNGSGATAATKVDPAFARFADDGAPTVAPIAPRPTSTESERGGGGGDGLEAAQIRTVVSREQRGLQACWEVAIRGMREVPTVRMDVDITIGASGTVTQSTARGVGVGNLSECLERNVRRWRFPASDGTSRTSFPVVFQGS